MGKNITFIGYTNIVRDKGHPDEMENFGITTIADSIFQVDYDDVVFHPRSMISVSNPSDRKKAFVVFALWDTGSSTSSISEDLAEKMGLAVAGETTYVIPSGTEQRPTHYVNVTIGNDDLGRLLVTNYKMERHDCDFLIGMDIISKGKLIVDSTSGKTTVTFEM